MELANLSEREQKLIYLAYAVVLLLCIIALYMFMLSPELNRYTSVYKRYKSQQEQYKQIIDRRDILLKEYQELKTRSDKTLRVIFSKSEAENWLEMLPQLSEQTGNIITSITPQDSHSVLNIDSSKNQTKVDKGVISKLKTPEQNKESVSIRAGISEMPVTVDIRGKYDNIINIFDTLEGFKQLMVISEFSAARANQDPDAVETKFLLNLIHTDSDMKVLPIEKQSKATQMPTKMAKATQIPTKMAKDVKPVVKLAQNASPTIRVSKNLKVRMSYLVRVGKFVSYENAEKLAKMLKSDNYNPWIKPNSYKGKTTYQVYVGKFQSKDKAEDFTWLMQKRLSYIDDYAIIANKSTIRQNY